MYSLFEESSVLLWRVPMNANEIYGYIKDGFSVWCHTNKTFLENDR